MLAEVQKQATVLGCSVRERVTMSRVLPADQDVTGSAGTWGTKVTHRDFWERSHLHSWPYGVDGMEGQKRLYLRDSLSINQCH